MTITSSHIDLLRHGDVQGGPCYRGITDDPLSVKGWQQMHNKVGSQTPWALIISSPLSRCHDFAKQLADNTQLPLIMTPAFQEINFGDWEGKTAEQIDSQQIAKFYADPVNYPPPHGEHLNDFQQRILVAWQSLLEVHQGKRILLITHAGVIRVILAHILGMDHQHSFRLKINHACLSSIECFHEPHAENFLQLIKHE